MKTKAQHFSKAKKWLAVMLTSALTLGMVFAVPLTTAVAETAGLYTFNFESASASDYTVYTSSALIEKEEVATIDTTNAISGTESLLISSPLSTSNNNQNQRVCVELGKFDTTKTYRVSGSFQLLEGKAGGLYIVNTAANPTHDQFYNYSTLSGLGRAIEVHASGSGWTEKTLQTFSGTMKTSGGLGNIAIAFKAAGSNSAKVLFDDIVIAEIVTVSATSADDAMGTVAVTNKAGHTDYAAGETAEFKATAKDGYIFKEWQNAEGTQVSDKETFELELKDTETALTAVFEKEPNEEHLLNFEADTNADNYTVIGRLDTVTLSIDEADNIAGSKSLKVTFSQAGDDNTNRHGIVLGKYNTAKTYRVSGKYRVKSGELGQLWVVNSGNIGSSATGSNFLNEAIPTTRRFTVHTGTLAASETVHTFGGTISPEKSSGNISFGIRPTSAATSGTEVIFDDISIVEVEPIAVTATVDDASKGEATVTNGTKPEFSDFILDETAVFKATAKAGYEFTHWENAGGKVSTDATYTCTVTEAVTLKACFEEAEIGIKTMYNNLAALRSADNSSTEKNGLRVYNQITKDWIANTEIVEFGSIAAYEEKLGEAELTLSADGIAKGVSFKKYEIPAKIWEENDDDYIFTTYLTGISAYDKDIVVRVYAIDAEENVYYGEELKISVFAVANAMDNLNTADGSVPAEIDIASFAQFVTDENKQTYSDWCANNSTNTGKLFEHWYGSAE